jgi:hypothetical protein
MKENIDPEKVVGKLDSESQDMLKKIALESPNDSVIIAAIRRIKDQAFIKKFVLDEKNRTSLRCDALPNLAAPQDLLDCVFDSDNEYIRDAADELAADKLSEKDRAEHMIRRLREAGDSFSFPKRYMEYLTDPSDLLKIIQHDKKGETREQAWDTAKEIKLQNDPMLAKLSGQMAVEEVSAHARRGAVQFTEDQEALAYAALHDPEWPIREMAVSKLTDQRALADVAVNDTDEKIRQIAKEKIEKESLLRKARRQHVHKFVLLTLYEKNAAGRMERMTDFKKCTICGEYFCCNDLYKDEPFCNYPWECSHIDTSRDGERVCFTCEETGDNMYGYLLSRDPRPII